MNATARFFMLGHVETATPFLIGVLPVLSYLAYRLVRWQFRRLEVKYGLRPWEVVRIWLQVVWAEMRWLVPVVAVAAVLLALLQMHWIVCIVAPVALVPWAGAAITAHRLRSAYPPTIGGVVEKE